MTHCSKVQMNQPEAYLHRAQDILEHIHHTNNMSEITTIGTNHPKILTGLKDKNCVVN